MHPIFERIQDDDLAAVTEILARDPAAVQASDPGLGSTPLHFAAHRGFEGIADALLEAEADVHARERVSGTTPLHWAAEGGHASLAAKLLARGARLDAVDEWFALTPLGWATVVVWNPTFHEDRAATAELLVRAGAEVAVFPAIARGDAAELRAALERRPEAVHDRLGFVGWGITPLHVAVDRGDEPLVAALLEAGADPNAISELGHTPLGHALASRKDRLAAMLRDRGARDDAGTALAGGDLQALERRLPGVPPATVDRLLFTAARAGQDAAVAVLLRHGANPNAGLFHLLGECPAPVSALQAAVTSGSGPAARTLLDAGADPNPGAAERWPTPLHYAAGAGQAALVALLLERGADRSARDRDYGATPADWAAFAGQTEVLAMLGASGSEPA